MNKIKFLRILLSFFFILLPVPLVSYQEIITKLSVLKLSPYVFAQEFYSFMSYI